MRKASDEEKRRIIDEANQAKDRMAEIAYKLEAAGFKRKAKSAMSIVYKIEEWQNSN